jgi:hypothetical protein
MQSLDINVMEQSKFKSKNRSAASKQTEALWQIMSL